MKNTQSKILEDILDAIGDSESADQSLDRIVRLIALTFSIDVCSVYIYNPYINNLVLKATVGLNKESVDVIEMDVNEGLTGMVIETMETVFIVNPSTHPRYKYYADSGEEKFMTYLGIPLIYNKKVIGALVVQTLDKDGITHSDVTIFKNIANQIAVTVAYIILQNEKNVINKEKSINIINNTTDDQMKVENNDYLRGEPVSDRVAFGYAHYMSAYIDFEQITYMRINDVDSEIKRLDNAFELSINQIKEISDNSHGLSYQDKAIIDAHIMYLSDDMLRRKIIAHIKEKISAEYALKQVILDYANMFKAFNDLYLSERSTDILDIGRRVLANLVGIKEETNQAFKPETIIIASDISPVDLLSIRQPNLKGIVLAKGGRTSHTVIMSKSLEIPIVIGVENLFENIRTNDYLIVDGISGFIYINPSSNILEEYKRRQEDNQRAFQKLEGLRDQLAVTKDGFTVRMGANIGLLSDIMLAKDYGADHIGLYRTEFPFLLRKTFPTEEDQVSLYKRVINKSDGRYITIRTFDVGGDKFLPYLDYPKEDNPFLGWRSIRLSLSLEVYFRTQIRAILRASDFGKIKILFPMISSIDEIHKVKTIVSEEKEKLDRLKVNYDPNIEIGIMIEVPAAVPILDRLLQYVDFVNIGTNDLIQYLLAVDRNNKKVASYYNVMHPSVISTINQIVSICNQCNKQISICGEAAAIKKCIYLFIGMGVNQLSMTPSAIPFAKQFIQSVNKTEANNALIKCLEMENASNIETYIEKKLNKVSRKI